MRVLIRLLLLEEAFCGLDLGFCYWDANLWKRIDALPLFYDRADDGWELLKGHNFYYQNILQGYFFFPKFSKFW